jgi:hypothetical protein
MTTQPPAHLPRFYTPADEPEAGDVVMFEFGNMPPVVEGNELCIVFFHALYNISILFDAKCSTVYELAVSKDRGLAIAVVADRHGMRQRRAFWRGRWIF